MSRSLIILLLLLVSVTSFTQDVKLVQNLSPNEKRANELFADYRLEEAADLFKLVFKKNNRRKDVALKIATCYHDLKKYEEAEKWYQTGMERNARVAPVFFLKFAQVLISNDKPDKARSWIEKYLEKNEGDTQAQLMLLSLEKKTMFFADSASVDIQFLEINTRNAEYSPAFLGYGIAFVSDRHSMELSDAIGWDSREYSRIFYTEEMENGELESPKEIKDFTSTFDEGPATFYGRGEVIFTRISKGSAKSENPRLELYYAKYDSTKKKWSEPDPLPFNSTKYSVGHPTVSADGSTLVFTSTAPGGQGQSDLYISKMVNGKWARPENLGDVINTNQDEMFPAFIGNDQLVFASSGHGGLGDLDMFRTTLSPTSETEIVNLGAPYNSSSADFGLVLSPLGSSGYFSSNRKNGGLDDDIYHFSLKWTRLTVKVQDVEGEPISDASAQMILAGDTKDRQFSDSLGVAFLNSFPNERAQLTVQKKGYKPYSREITSGKVEFGGGTEVVVVLQKEEIVTQKQTNKTSVSASPKAEKVTALVLVNDRIYEYHEIGDYRYLANADEKILLEKEPVDFDQPLEQRVKAAVQAKGLTLGRYFYIYNAYFEFDSYDLSDSSKTELDKVIEVMKVDKQVAFEVNTFTDSRGSSKYNDELAFKRSQSISRYLQENDVEGSRLILESYGEQGLTNDCSDVKECEEEFHAQNRRAEFNLVMRKLYR